MSAILEPVDASPAVRTMPRWKSASSAASAAILSFLFLVSGCWKISDLEATSERMVQSLVPVVLSMPAAIAVAVFEAFAGVLLLIPRYRRWGAWIAGAMLAAFMIYMGVLYDRLLGEDCNCFPWIQRVVGPVFFAGDAAMLLLALVAGLWSRRSDGLRRAALVFFVVCAFAAGSLALSSIRRANADAPATATVDGKAFDLRRGRVLLYFFDPECSHCYTVAGEMAKRNWGSTRILVLATREPRFTRDFLASTGLRAGISADAQSLRSVFPFTDPPYAVALHHGRAVATFNSGQMESEDYYRTLRRLGHLN
jgi:hypothetical protein